MKKIFFILLIIILLIIIYSFNKEHFYADISKPNLYNIFNTHNALKCEIQTDTNSNAKDIAINDNDYTQCFTDNSVKYVLIDKDNNKCTTYDTISCKDKGTKGGSILSDIEFNSPILFKDKSRNLLIKNTSESKATTASTTASATTIASKDIKFPIHNHIDNLYKKTEYSQNLENFKGKDEIELITKIDMTNYINVNDLFCCLAEHLFIIRIVPTPNNLNMASITKSLNEFIFNNNLLNEIFDKIPKDIIEDLDITNNKIGLFYRFFDKKKPNLELCYNLQVLKIIVLYMIIISIKKFDFLKKFNSRYITYLFYSFKRGYRLWGDYFKKSIDSYNLSKPVSAFLKYFITTVFFSNQNNENIYKLFILINATINNVKMNYYNDTENKTNIKILGQDPNVIDRF